MTAKFETIEADTVSLLLAAHKNGRKGETRSHEHTVDDTSVAIDCPSIIKSVT
jgi:hypothetical protein